MKQLTYVHDIQHAIQIPTSEHQAVDGDGDESDLKTLDWSSSDRNAAEICDVSGNDAESRHGGRWHETYMRGRRRAVMSMVIRRASYGETDEWDAVLC